MKTAMASVIQSCFIMLISIVGRPPVSNWVAFSAKTGGYDVEIVLDERSVYNSNQRANYRLQIQGPAAAAIFAELNGGMTPDVKFFHMGEIKIGSYSATALNHSMSRSAGLEFWGPMEEREAVIATCAGYLVIRLDMRGKQTGWEVSYCFALPSH
jgi:glycine cleavage system aminomethyltransferase T